MPKKKTTVPPDEAPISGSDSVMNASPEEGTGSEELISAVEPLGAAGEISGEGDMLPDVSGYTAPPDDADPLLLGDAGDPPQEGESSAEDTAAGTGEESVPGEGATPGERAAPGEGTAPGEDVVEPQYEALLRELGGSPPLETAGTNGGDEALMLGDGADQAGHIREKDTSAPPSDDRTPASEEGAEESPARTADRDGYVLTINARERIETDEDRAELVWHEIRTSHINGRMLTGTLDGVEQTESGMTIVVVDYKGYRIAIPIREMMLHKGSIPYGAEYYSLMDRLNRIASSMMGAEIDFIVRGIDKASRSVVASRRAAMLRKRQTFYMDASEATGAPLVYEGRVVQARVVGVAEKALRVEVFGVECVILARDLSVDWLGDARDRYSVGDRVLVRVQTIDRSDINNISITADIRSISSDTSQDRLQKCQVQSKYVGRVTDFRHGVAYIRLNNGVNAIAHTCLDRRMPGKKDDVSFAVTRLDEERGVAVGIITRIIKQNL